MRRRSFRRWLRRTGDRSWSGLRNLIFRNLFIERSEREIVALANRGHKSANSIEQSAVIIAARKSRPHALAHFTNHTVGQLALNSFAELSKEVRLLDYNYQQDTFVRARRRADVPIFGDTQRIIIKIFAAGTLNDRDDELYFCALLQICEDSLQTLLS